MLESMTAWPRLRLYLQGLPRLKALRLLGLWPRLLVLSFTAHPKAMNQSSLL